MVATVVVVSFCLILYCWVCLLASGVSRSIVTLDQTYGDWPLEKRRITSRFSLYSCWYVCCLCSALFLLCPPTLPRFSLFVFVPLFLLTRHSQSEPSWNRMGGIRKSATSQCDSALTLRRYNITRYLKKITVPSVAVAFEEKTSIGGKSGNLSSGYFFSSSIFFFSLGISKWHFQFPSISTHDVLFTFANR